MTAAFIVVNIKQQESRFRKTCLLMFNVKRCPNTIPHLHVLMIYGKQTLTFIVLKFDVLHYKSGCMIIRSWDPEFEPQCHQGVNCDGQCWGFCRFSRGSSVSPISSHQHSPLSIAQLHVRGIFFKGLIGREITTTVRIRRSFMQMCCALSLSMSVNRNTSHLSVLGA